MDSTVGGVAIFVKSGLCQQQLDQYKLTKTATNRIENV
jgi:hypothetical protein